MTDSKKQPKTQWWELEDEQMDIQRNSFWDDVWQDKYWKDASVPSDDDGFGELTDSSFTVKPKYVAKTYDHTPETYYFAYGSNLHDPQMTRRCKDSVPVASCKLQGWRLVFRGVADIEYSGNDADYVHGAIYKVSEWDESQLDIYEGFPNLYRKEYFDATMNDTGDKMHVMFYKMNNNGYATPPKGYFDTIADGFIHWDLETEKLEEAVRFTENQKGGTVNRHVLPKPHGYAKWAGKGEQGVLGHPANSSLVGARIESLRKEQSEQIAKPPTTTK